MYLQVDKTQVGLEKYIFSREWLTRENQQLIFCVLEWLQVTQIDKNTQTSIDSSIFSIKLFQKTMLDLF